MALPRHMVFSAGEAWRMVRQLPSEAKILSERLKTYAAAFGSREVDPVVVTGEPSASIVDQAVDSAADLIVMGVAPRRWLDELVFGSTLRAVLRKAHMPVLVLPVVAGAHGWIDRLQGDAPPVAVGGATAAELAA
jgi:nucleotide-binding universal stress UspA family protein